MHLFKAYKLMRGGILVGGLLTNSESWINVTQKNLEDLEKPDAILQRKILSSVGNPSKVFMMLEFGLIPVRYVIMQKRMLFLYYILQESTNTMIRQVFDTLRDDSRNGDFIYLSNLDRKELKIQLTNVEIQDLSKLQWKKIVREKN